MTAEFARLLGLGLSDKNRQMIGRLIEVLVIHDPTPFGLGLS